MLELPWNEDSDMLPQHTCTYMHKCSEKYEKNFLLHLCS